MNKRKNLWITLCLINLCIVALLGLLLRSKILFSIPFLNYRHLLSAHSHFAFGGWAGLALMTLLIYQLLPAALSQKGIYQWILAGIEISSLGMFATFPLWGYTAVPIFFSSLYIVVYFVFAVVFVKDVLRLKLNPQVRLLSVSAIASLIISSIGPLGLSIILYTKSSNSILYRDSVYTFLHFQYNGFFTLSIFALIYQQFLQKVTVIPQAAKRFALFLCLSVVPALFLSLLWHNYIAFYVLAVIGCIFIILSLIQFFILQKHVKAAGMYASRFAYLFFIFSILSFAVKMALNVGTVFPHLGDAVYGARPIIIGFLHLVFLGFLTFYILSLFIEQGLFTIGNKIVTFPFWVFAAGIFANEGFLMLQGLGILFNFNSSLYNWLLWGAAITLFIGSALIVTARQRALKRGITQNL